MPPAAVIKILSKQWWRQKESQLKVMRKSRPSRRLKAARLNSSVRNILKSVYFGESRVSKQGSCRGKFDAVDAHVLIKRYKNSFGFREWHFIERRGTKESTNSIPPPVDQSGCRVSFHTTGALCVRGRSRLVASVDLLTADYCSRTGGTNYCRTATPWVDGRTTKYRESPNG